MRIIIEADHPAEAAQLAALMEAGAPDSKLLMALGGATPGQAVEPVVGLQDAGPPPAWLSESVRKAYEQDSRHFDFKPRSDREGDGGEGPVDGGSAPQTDAR